VIEAIDLTKRYEDGLLALDALSLRVDPGEIYCLLGANGAGKTTAINLFLNFISPTSGKALLHGIDVDKDPLEAKKYVAFLAENVMLYGNFTARQNLDFFVRLGGRLNLSREEQYMALREAGLPENAFERKVKEFSKGMRQKVGVAIAIAKQAPAFLLDEPTSGLDPKAGSDFQHTLYQLREAGKAVLMSTHDIFRVKDLADRVGIMKEGRKLVELDRDELRNENLEALYLEYMRGDPADGRG
jgi:ABC-2 type transport system ATP-binding protein